MGRCALLGAAIASAQTGSTQAPPIDVHQLLTEANTAARGIGNSFQRGLVLDRVGAAVASTGDLESAAGISERAYPNNMSSLTAIGRQFAKSGNLSKAHAITDHLPGGGGSTVLAFMAKGQAQHGGIQRAMAIAGEIKAPEVRSYALKEIAQEQAAAGDYAGARKTIKAANSAYPAQQSSASDIESTIAEAQIKRGEINAAHATIRSLGQPDAPLAMLDGSQLLLESGNTAAAHDWLEEAISNRWNSEGTHFLEYMAIPMEIKLGLKERAFSSANVMGAKGYVAVAITCIETGDLGCAHDALLKMQDSPTQKGEDEHMSAFEKQLDVLNVAAALIDHNALDEAEGLLNSTESSLDSLSKISILPSERDMQKREYRPFEFVEKRSAIRNVVTH